MNLAQQEASHLLYAAEMAFADGAIAMFITMATPDLSEVTSTPIFNFSPYLDDQNAVMAFRYGKQVADGYRRLGVTYEVRDGDGTRYWKAGYVCPNPRRVYTFARKYMVDYWTRLGARGVASA